MRPFGDIDNNFFWALNLVIFCSNEIFYINDPPITGKNNRGLRTKLFQNEFLTTVFKTTKTQRFKKLHKIYFVKKWSKINFRDNIYFLQTPIYHKVP